MTNFIDAMKKALNEKENVSVTENGSVGYKTTRKELLDINFSLTSLRNERELEICERLEKVYNEDPLLAVKWIFYAGDVREGAGERRFFRIAIKWLATYKYNVASALLHLIPEYTRWDNLLPLLETRLKDEVMKLIKKQLYEDIDKYSRGEPISLLAKWLPSSNASSKITKKYARIVVTNLKITDKVYRKTLSALRSHLKIIETQMSKKEWNKIDYSTVPSKANLKYKNAFLRNDHERRTEYLESLSKGENKINASVLFPHDIVHRYAMNQNLYSYYNRERVVDSTLEELWKALPNYVQDDSKTICVCDGSGSMLSSIDNRSNTRCLDVAIALSIYFSERCSGEFKNKFITFSESPKLVEMDKCRSLLGKILKVLEYDEVANTNIEAVFDLILDIAISNKMEQKDLPDNILILSDMEFDSCVRTNDSLVHMVSWGPTNSQLSYTFNVIVKKYEDAGYKLPRLVFWNINSRTQTIPVKENELGVALVSGYSPAIVKMVLSNKTDPYECLVEQLNSERYDDVETCLKGITL